MNLIEQIVIGVVVGRLVWFVLQMLASVIGGVIIGAFNLDRKWAALFK